MLASNTRPTLSSSAERPRDLRGAFAWTNQPDFQSRLVYQKSTPLRGAIALVFRVQGGTGAFMFARPEDLDPIRLLEAIYDLEQPRERWFRGVLETAGAELDRGRGVGMVLYDVSEAKPRVERLEALNVPPMGREIGVELHADPEFAEEVVNGYRTAVCATLDEHVPNLAQRASIRAHYRPLDVCDQILINGSNESGLGCALYVFSRTPISLEAQERGLFTRIATHLSTAYRLHRRLGEIPPNDGKDGAPAAVLRTDGRVEHAGSSASASEARELLTMAVKAHEWARTRAGRREPQRATGAWRPLVDSRWSLVDRYEHDGRRYVVVCENLPAPNTLETLSPRELQVVSLAARGRTNKVIAYELGLVDSTVRVLVARAAAKLAAGSRSELIAKFRALQQRARARPPDAGADS